MNKNKRFTQKFMQNGKYKFFADLILEQADQIQKNNLILL